ncbi:protein chibby homolog 2 [Chelonoidis abingdonii]|nr:spermatid-associated protein [Chelonoidis abingdonii]
MNHQMQRVEPDMDYIPPRVKLSDETFVFVDGKWVSETYNRPPFASQQKHYNKKMQNDWTLWEENKALWEENKALRIENKALREENKTLQCLRTQNKAIQVIYDETLQQVLQENKPFPIFRGRNIGFQASQENKSLQVVREKNMALQVLREETQAVPVFQKETEATPIKEESKDDSKANPIQDESKAGSALQKKSNSVQDIWEESKTVPVQEENKAAPGIQEENVVLQAVQKLNQTLQALLKENQTLLEEKKAIQVLREENKVFWEENNKLKLQLTVVKCTVSEIMARMEILQKELNALSPVQCNEMRKPDRCW